MFFKSSCRLLLRLRIPGLHHRIGFLQPFLDVTDEDGEHEDAHEPGAGHEEDLRDVVLRGLGVLADRDGRLGGKIEAPDK